MTDGWVNDNNAALLTDLYELAMLQSYTELGMRDTAVFDLFIRRLPPQRNYLVACGLEDVLHYLETFRFPPEALAYLRTLGTFSDSFIDGLKDFRFAGDVYAMREGTIAFANEPLLEVVAPLPEAQFVETFLLNQVHLQTLAASKAARVVCAAGGRPIVDFGLRRTHGADAGLKSARAFYIAGVQATSNVLAGQIYGIPVAGTMAHSYIQAHENEMEAFEKFVSAFPTTTLLVDTYDAIVGVCRIVELSRRMGENFRLRGIRLDSGNLEQLSKHARAILDQAGLSQVEIFASNNLDEYAIERLLTSGAPIDGFGVGTKMSVSNDVPYLDSAYKLVEYAGKPRMKLSESKSNLPGRKQVFRQQERDFISLHDEVIAGEPLLYKAMEAGRRTEAAEPLERARQRFAEDLRKLPGRMLAMESANPPYSIEISAGLRTLRNQLSGRLKRHS